MNFHIKKSLSILSLLCGTLCSFNGYAESWQITDFRFGMGEPSFSSWNLGGQSPTPIDPSQYGILVEGTYQGTNTTHALTNFTFFTFNTYVYTSNVNEGYVNTPAGTITGGPAPTINLTTLEADMSSWFVQWNGTEFSQGNGSPSAACISNEWGDRLPFADLLEDPASQIATVTDHHDGTITIDWLSCITGGDFNSNVGFWRLELSCTTCAVTVFDPDDTLTVTQNGFTTQTVSTTVADGPVTVTSAKGANPANHTYTWTASHASITDTDGDQGTFTFDPTVVPVGTYTISHQYEDTSVADTHIGIGSTQINVITDSVAAHIDTDSDGIPDLYDSGSLNAQQIQSEYSNDSTYVLSTDAGTIKIGSTAFCVSAGARITQADIIASGGNNCTAVTNASDDLIKAVGVGGFYDFEINGLASAGDVANIVIPLTAAIPPHATYRKFNPTTISGWSLFTVGDGNPYTDAYASAASTSTGVCPAAGSTAYVAGLNQGDDCLQLTITDGGPNDTDGIANRSIKDPGGVAEVQSGVEAQLAGGCSISGNPQNLNEHSEWILLSAFIAWLGFIAYRRKQAEQ